MSIRGRIVGVIVLAVAGLAVAPQVVLAQTGTLFVEGNNVGIGTATPAFKLDVQGDDGASTRLQVVESSPTNASRTLFKVSNNGYPRFTLEDSSTGEQWVMAIVGGGAFQFNKVGTGVVEFKSSGGGDLQIAGEMNATAFNTSSSRTLKEGFVDMDGEDVLSKVISLPIEEWSFKGDETRHLGPMAEDFRAAFGLGDSSRRIGLMDAAGVNMAAIQGLHKMIEERDDRIQGLEQRVAELETMIQKLAASTDTEK